MRLKQYQIDAFTGKVFKGNPAAVCPLDKWLDDGVLLSIAAENNLSETAFFVPSKKGFKLRWFTPVTEVDLCGHATLASAHVIFNITGYTGKFVTFETRSRGYYRRAQRQPSFHEFSFHSSQAMRCAGFTH